MSDWDDGYKLGVRNGLELGRRAAMDRIVNMLLYVVVFVAVVYLAGGFS